MKYILTLLALITVIANCKGKTYEDTTSLNQTTTTSPPVTQQIIVKVNHS